MMPSISSPFYAEVKNMVVRSQSEIDELLLKRDLVALREMRKNRPLLQHWSRSWPS